MKASLEESLRSLYATLLLLTDKQTRALVPPRVRPADIDTTPMRGQCTAVSYVVLRLYGGRLIGGRIGTETHIWNRLPDGVEVDLTSTQYGGDGLHPLGTGRAFPTDRRVPSYAAELWDRYCLVTNTSGGVYA